MATTYTLISSTTLTATSTTVTFSSIPNTYTDLVLRISGRVSFNATNTNIIARLNSSTATNYSTTTLQGSGTTAFSARLSNFDSLNYNKVAGSTNTANTFSSVEIYFPNYTSSVNKPISGWSASEDNSASNNQMAIVADLWQVTSAITTITLTNDDAGNFVTSSSFSLYGIKNS